MHLNAYSIKSPLHSIGLAICVVATVLLTNPLHAQAPISAQDRAALLRSQANPSYTPSPTTGEEEGYAVTTPNDKDLGEQQILKHAEEYQPFTASVAAAFYYTSNVALTRNAVEHDWVFAPGVSINYQPRFTTSLYGQFGVAQQFFVYDRFPAFNFGSLDVFAGVVYLVPQWHNLSLRARYNFNRLTSDGYEQFFNDQAIYLNADVPFRIDRAQQISIGANVNISLDANPAAPGRDDFGFYGIYSVNLSRSWSLSAAGTIVVRDYTDINRTDVSEILALSANYRVREWFTISFLSSFAWNQSNQNVFEYSVANVGGGIAFTVRF